MLRVYLDQLHWVSLTKARIGHKEGARFEGALLVLREGVERGWVSCPLSMYHFMEAWYRRDAESRLQLAQTMSELSRWHTIGHHRTLVAAEIDRALNGAFGRPAFPRAPQVFGVGINHAMGRPIADYEPPEDALLTPQQRQALKRIGSMLLQAAVFIGPPAGFEAPNFDPFASRRVAEQFANEQEKMRDVRRPHGYHRGDRGRRATSVEILAGEFEPVLTEALALAGLEWTDLTALEADGMELLLRCVPTMFVHRELRRLRHEASPKPWEAGDLVDLTALSSAIVNCDVVVTERVWTDIASRAKLDEQFGTPVLRDLDDLVPHLVSAQSA